MDHAGETTGVLCAVTIVSMTGNLTNHGFQESNDRGEVRRRLPWLPVARSQSIHSPRRPPACREERTCGRANAAAGRRASHESQIDAIAHKGHSAGVMGCSSMHFVPSRTGSVEARSGARSCIGTRSLPTADAGCRLESETSVVVGPGGTSRPPSFAIAGLKSWGRQSRTCRPV